MAQALKILIVEDDPTIRTALSLLLQHLNYDVVTASYGGEMLSKMDGVDVIVTDINMPYLDGVAATNIARHIMDIKIPIIAMTGLLFEEIPPGVGFTQILHKPIDVNHLIKFLKEV